MAVVRAKGINKNALRQARINSMYEIEDIAKKIGNKADKIKSWEEGKEYPTFKQLSALSKFYRYPSAFFFMDELPKKKEFPTDFRTMPLQTLDEIPKINHEREDADEKRTLALELCSIIGINIKNFDIKCEIDDDYIVVAERIRKYLRISIEKQFKWRNDEYIVFNKWREILEDFGIITFQFSGIDPKEIRGFSIAEHPLPVIGVNKKDAPSARIFTIFHELTHILLGEGGVCDWESKDSKTEKFCNNVAGEFLIPRANLLQEKIVLEKESLEWEDAELFELGKKFSVSREAILIALVQAKKATESFYWHKKRQWKIENEQNEDDGGWGLEYQKIRSNNGRFYTNILFEAYDNKIITKHDFSNYLGDVKWEHIEKMRK